MARVSLGELSARKHIIFLGAGASYGSGYPLANGLRLLVSSRQKWREALAKYEEEHKLEKDAIVKPGLAYWDHYKESLELFREGGFGTLDEFCKLAGASELHDEINDLGHLVRAGLALFNPEAQFEKSEYYAFVQSLFNAEDLATLREDVTVLTLRCSPFVRPLEAFFNLVFCSLQSPF